MNFNDWSHLLLSAEQASNTSPKQAAHLADSINAKALTLANGVSAIGCLLACTASNGKTGLAPETATNIGWLLESLGELTATLIHTGEHASEAANG